MVRVTCTALHCPSSSRTHDVKFHQLPHDTKRRQLWLSACNRTDVIDKDASFFKHKYVCSLHFHKCMYTSNEHLRKTAVPSLHFSAKPKQQDSCTQTEEQYVGSYQSIEEPPNQNNSSILNVNKDCTTYTQNEDSLQYNVHAVDVKEEPELSEPDVEMETENSDGTDDEDSNVDTSEEAEDIKPDIGETEILPIPQSTQSTQSLNSLNSRDNIDSEESEPFEPDAEIKTENDDNVDKNCDLEKSEEVLEIKQEISETEIIPLHQSTQFLESVHSLPYHIDHVGTKETITSRIKFEEQESCEDEENEVGETEIIPLTPSLHSEDSETMKDTEILCIQSKKSLQEDQDQTVTIVNRTKRTITVNSASIQTDRVIVLNQNLDGTVSVNPDNCTCEENNRVQMSRAQFYRSCSQFLSPSFSEIVRKQINLDRFKKQVEKELSSAGNNSSEGVAPLDVLKKIKRASTVFTDSAADFAGESTGAKKKRTGVAKNIL